MGKFKTGDFVRVVTQGEMIEYNGKTGTLTENNDGVYPYRVDLGDDFWIKEGRLFNEDELELVEDKPFVNGYVYYTDWDGEYRVVANLSDIPSDALWVWELGDELVKKVTWEKKDV